MATHVPAVEVPVTVSRLRALLLVATLLAAAGVLATFDASAKATVEADLARVLQFMAALKLAFAACALGVSYWRLARPAEGWRGIAYVAGPPLSLGGGLLMLSLTHPGLAAVGVHAGLAMVIAAALTDPAFFAERMSSRAGRGRSPV
ncbi:hypothetical protein ASG52_00240 [Methylobacterium sp. Leaf456]|uniref:hypothetical protein n=1 Tax=Methylobacterium sp. Leaf456 TaxID=1736382 RepID=UPI0006F457B0|nr:hypothetical protein [Methylobacterium sp. Leaf456]KQT61355.1 hypothetical protein ASG52_00240 [Methylobacterium sp. Leaf456]